MRYGKASPLSSNEIISSVLHNVTNCSTNEHDKQSTCLEQNCTRLLNDIWKGVCSRSQPQRRPTLIVRATWQYQQHTPHDFCTFLLPSTTAKEKISSSHHSVKPLPTLGHLQYLPRPFQLAPSLTLTSAIRQISPQPSHLST